MLKAININWETDGKMLIYQPKLKYQPKLLKYTKRTEMIML